MRNIVILNSLHFSYPLPILMRVSYNTLIVKQNTSDYYKYTDNISSMNKNGELFNLILLPEYLIFVSRNEETSLHNSSDPFSPDYLFRGGSIYCSLLLFPL